MNNILILGVNPFEDAPGYQLFSLLKSSERYNVVAGDDSDAALRILRLTGADIAAVPQPGGDISGFAAAVVRLCEERSIDVLLPGSDSYVYGLAQSILAAPQLTRLCPYLGWVASNTLRDKWDIQEWVTRHAITPPRWRFDNESDACGFGEQGLYPLMVKGPRKGAAKCNDAIEAVAARRTLSSYPANAGARPYAESVIEGEEHSFFVLLGDGGKQIAQFAFRKLAATQMGTTVAGQVDSEPPSCLDLTSLISSIRTPIPIEIEWRKDASGAQCVFEVNLRFPSWVGSLGVFGLSLVEAYIHSVQQGNQGHGELLAPMEGTIFYRLPQSGFLPLNQVFTSNDGDQKWPASVRERPGKLPLLWKSASPHLFQSK
ncbi:MAG TPA: hypothetical protein VHU83_05010 [Bryobacteraceae bacterium]|jgi:hypothetical protein|nr:hypothetical protein [Bryobacteraceae bacterium]